MAKRQGKDLQQTERERSADAVFERVGVPGKVAIARSRTLAKLISDAAKPFGALRVLNEQKHRKLLSGAAGDGDHPR